MIGYRAFAGALFAGMAVMAAAGQANAVTTTPGVDECSITYPSGNTTKTQTFTLPGALQAECREGNDLGSGGIDSATSILGKTGWIRADTNEDTDDGSSDDEGDNTFKVLLPTTGGDQKFGDWKVDGWGSATEAMLVVKSGGAFGAFLWATLNGTMGTWTSEPSAQSHFSAYYRTDNNNNNGVIPLPPGMLLILSGLGVAAAVRRRLA